MGQSGFRSVMKMTFLCKACTIRNILLWCENVVPLFAKAAFVGTRDCEQKKVWQIRRNSFA